MRRVGEKPPKPVSLNKNNKYQMKSIQKKRILKNKTQFLIKQINYPEHQNTQKPPEYLEKYDKLLKEFRIYLERVKIVKRTLRY